MERFQLNMRTATHLSGFIERAKSVDLELIIIKYSTKYSKKKLQLTNQVLMKGCGVVI